MKATISTVSITDRDVELPDHCANCGHDLRTAITTIGYVCTAWRGPLGDQDPSDAELAEDGHPTMYLCPCCGAEVPATDVEASYATVG